MAPALTFVVPLYHSAETIEGVVREIEALTIEGGHEIVLVNDGSTDRTGEVVSRARSRTRACRSRSSSTRATSASTTRC